MIAELSSDQLDYDLCGSYEVQEHKCIFINLSHGTSIQVIHWEINLKVWFWDVNLYDKNVS